MAGMVLDPDRPNHWASPQTPYETDALAFCRAWLSGQDTFTLHTSGSTGVPKPIQLTRAQMQASAHLTGQALGLTPGDAALVCLNIRYVAGLMMLVRGLELGLPMTVLEPVSNPLADFDPAGTHFRFTALVPLQLQTILASDGPAPGTGKLSILNAMKALLVGGAATSPALEQALQVIEAPVYATYGMTETVSHVALRRLNGPDRSAVFTALDGVELSTDWRGCLQITSAATNFTPIQTNDVVDLLDPTHFRLLGRADNVINSGGVKVPPEPIERVVQDVLAQFGLTLRLFVAGLPDERLGQRITVVSEQVAVTSEQWAAVQRAVRTQVGLYAVPGEWVTVPEFVQTATGKLDRSATIKRYT